MLGRKILLFLAIAYTLLLIGSSLLSLSGIPVEKLSLSDKLLHTVAYFGLVLVWYVGIFGFKNSSFSSKGLKIIVLSCIVFGIVIEILQGALTSYRQPELYDVVANCAGVLLAAAVILAKSKIVG